MKRMFLAAPFAAVATVPASAAPLYVGHGIPGKVFGDPSNKLPVDVCLVAADGTKSPLFGKALNFGEFEKIGVEKKIPATPATVYRMAPVTKTFTATAIMQLRDAGKLSLEDPVVKHLPWFKIKSPFADAPAITIRHLLTHTAGLPREAAYPYWTDNQFPTLDQIKDTLPNQEAVYAPETHWKYSNLGLALAGEIVAQVSGEPYEVYMRDHILKPLGMDSSTVLFPVGTRVRLAVAYGRRMPDGKREIRPDTDAKGIAPAANLSSTVEDLARYLAFTWVMGKWEEGRF